MTQKDYILLASVLRDALRDLSDVTPEGNASRDAVRTVAKLLGTALKRDRAAFDIDKWQRAIGS